LGFPNPVASDKLLNSGACYLDRAKILEIPLSGKQILQNRFVAVEWRK
jgi:hypothetical protein